MLKNVAIIPLFSVEEDGMYADAGRIRWLGDCLEFGCRSRTSSGRVFVGEIGGGIGLIITVSSTSMLEIKN